MKKRKQLLAAILAAAVCLGVGGCSGKWNGYSSVKKAQEGVMALESGRIVVTTSYEKGKKSGQMTTEFLFRQTVDGNISYCQTQFDRDNKSIYCEYCDGSRMEKWLIGRGWSPAEEHICNRENPHRYLKLLGTPVVKESVTQITSEADGENRRFLLTLDPVWLNENTYTDQTVEAVSETITLLVDKSGQLLRWYDEAVLLEVSSQKECLYRLDMQLTDPNTVGEIARPELRDNFSVRNE